MRIIIIVIGLIISTQLTAQAPTKELLDQQWRIVQGSSNKNKMMERTGLSLYRQASGNFTKSRIILSPNEQVVLVGFNRTDYGVMLITDDLKIKWKTPITGLAMGVGRFKDKILVIHSQDMKQRNQRQQVNATLLDPITGKKILTKTLYTSSINFYEEAELFFTPEDQDFSLGIRYTEMEIKSSFLGLGLSYDKYSKTSKFEVLSFNETLEEIKRVIVPIKKAFDFVQVEINPNHELFFLYYEGENSFGIQKTGKFFTEEKAYKRFSVDLREKNNFNMDFMISSKNTDIINFIITYKNTEKDRATGLYRINFTDETVKSTSTAYNKEFRREKKERYHPFDTKSNKLSTNEWDKMEIGNIIEFEDKIICLSEVQFSRIYERTQHSTTPSNSTKTGDAILSIYDSKLTLLDQQVIPKYIEYFGTEGIYTTIYIHDQTLVIVSGVRTGTFSVLPFFINYDLKQNKITRQDSPERGSIKKSIALSFDPSCTLWFEKSFVISYQRELGFSVSKNIASDLQKFNY